MKKAILFLCTLLIGLISFSGVYANAPYLVNNEFSGESELSEWTFVQKSSAGVPSVNDGKLVLSSETDDGSVKSPYCERTLNIPADKNFVIEYKVDTIPLSCRHYIYLNETQILQVADSPVGEFAIFVDRVNGLKAFKGGEEITPAQASFTDAVTKIQIMYQLRNIARGPVTFDYIRIYEVPDGFEILNSQSTEPEYIDVNFSAILPDTDIEDYVSVEGAAISSAAKLDTGLYRLNFESPLTAGESYTLSVNSLPANYGIVINKSNTFTVREGIKMISAELADTDFSSFTGTFSSSKTINITSVNEVDSTYDTVYVIAAAYDSEGKMTVLEVFDVENSTQQTTHTLPFTNESFYGDMTIEVYAVDDIKSMNRISDKKVYTVQNFFAILETVPKNDTQTAFSPEISVDPEYDNSVLKVTSSGEGAEGRDVSLIITKGYNADNETAPVLSKENIYYLRQGVVSGNEITFYAKMPDAMANYDLYVKTEKAEESVIPSVSGYLFYSAQVVENAFNALNTSVLVPENSEEKSFTDYVKGAEGTIFGISGYSDDISKVALALRDEQGGFSENGDIVQIFNLAEIIYTKHGGDAVGFLNYFNADFGFDDDAFTAYEEKIKGSENETDFNNSILSAQFDTKQGVKDTFHLTVVNYLLKNSKHYTDAKYVLDNLGEDVIGIDMTKYGKCNKKTVSEKLAKKTFESMDVLENTVSELIKKYPAVTVTVGGVVNENDNSDNYSGSYSGGTAAPSYKEKTATEIFNDVNSVSWAHEAIEKLYYAGIIQGRGNNKFEPSANITRAEVAKIICLALNLDMSGDISFADVSANDWSFSFIKAVYSAGIMKGTSEEIFSPGEYVTREMIATIIARAIRCSGKTLASDGDNFADINDAEDYAKESILSLKREGLVSGVDTVNFMPKNLCTRAEGAKMIYEAIKFLNK